MTRMKVSLICPVYNEEDSIKKLIDSMLDQTREPDEIIFVDSCSKDKTSDIIRSYKDKRIRLIQKKSNIPKARNIAIQSARNEIIACTDAGNILDKSWLENIVMPIEKGNADVVSGGVICSADKGISKYMAMLTMKPMERWDEKTFLPSGKSLAFKRSAWDGVKGYDESLDIGEDTDFALRLKKKGYIFKLEKSAIVYWSPRKNIVYFAKQFYLYGKGDGISGNIFSLPASLVFAIASPVYIISLFLSYLIEPLMSIGLIIGFVSYLMIIGILNSLKNKDIYCLLYIPPLLFVKRATYVSGVYKGMIEKFIASF